MRETADTETRDFLTREVLMHSSDTLPAATEKRLSVIRRDKPSEPVIYVASGSAAIIAGSEKSAAAAEVRSTGVRLMMTSPV